MTLKEVSFLSNALKKCHLIKCPEKKAIGLNAL
jgi:hypothetical protein